MAEHDCPRLPFPGFGESGHSIWRLKDGVALDALTGGFLSYPPSNAMSYAWWAERATCVGNFTDDADKKRKGISFSRLRQDDPSGTYIILSILLPTRPGGIAAMQHITFGAQASN